MKITSIFSWSRRNIMILKAEFFKITFYVFPIFFLIIVVFCLNNILYILSWLSPSWITWNKYSETMLRTLEKKILQFLKVPYRGWYVDIGPVVGPADKIWTISLNSESKNTPLILIHGLGAGVALWCMNLDAFGKERPVFAFDMLGFGRSSRPVFNNGSWEAEKQIVESIEEWRREMKLEKFILLGHSMGGFIATSYAMSHPQRVKHLILADPWGFPEKDKEYHDLPLWVRTMSYMLLPFNPLIGIRFAGPLGPWFINTIRPDISKKFAGSIQQDLVPQYIYQCNSQTPSGESAFHSMMSGFGWAKNPMVKRLDQLDADVPITLLNGSRSWIDSAAEAIKEKRMYSHFEHKVIFGAGHHVYADKPELFNQTVLEICDSVDRSNKILAIMPTETTKENKHGSNENNNQPR